jgi:hypothetical protein
VTGKSKSLELDNKAIYTVTITLSSTGGEGIVSVDGVFFDPDITDEQIDAGYVPWSYKVAAYMLKSLRKEALDIDEDDPSYPTISRSVM